MKNISILILITFLCSCKTIDSKEVLKSILKIEDLSDYNYEFLFVKDIETNFNPYTIYYKIDIDSLYYQELKSSEIDNCVELLRFSSRVFESEQVNFGNYNTFTKEDIPKWFDIDDAEIDIRAVYDIDSLRLNNCDGYYNAWVYLQYHNGNCYIILDHSFEVVDRN